MKYGVNPQKYANCGEEVKYNWTSSSMSRILRNVEYTGTLVLRKYVSPRIGARPSYRVPDDERIIHENRFEALVSKELFDEVNRLLDISKNATVPLEENKYRGLLMCGYCGKPMAYHKLKDKYYYYCRNEECGHPYSVSKKLIEATISDEIKYLKDYVLKHEEAIRVYAKDYYKKNKKVDDDSNLKALKELKHKAEKIDNYIIKLFEANARGDLPNSTYDLMMKKYKTEKEDIEGKISLLGPIKTNTVIDLEILVNQFINSIKELNVDNIDLSLLRKIICYIDIKSKSKRSREKKEFHFHYCDMVFWRNMSMKELLKNKKAAIYTRCSVESIYTKKESINFQVEFITKYCLENGFEIFKVYQDDGYSGSNFVEVR